MKKFLAIALTLCMLITSVVFVSAEETAEYGVVDSVVVNNCDEGLYFIGGAADTELKMEGAGSHKYSFAAGDVAHAGVMIQLALDTPVDATGMNRYAFDLYVSSAEAIKDLPFCIELTSAGTYDKEELQTIVTLSSLTEEKALVDGWNTITISIEGATGCDFTRFNFMRLFSNAAFTLANELIVALDNVRFEKYIPEPAPVVDGVEVHQFIVFNENETPYLVRTNAGKTSDRRFSDGTFETVYKYTVTNRYNVNKITWKAKLGAQLLLQVSQDDTNWTTIYSYEWIDGEKESQGVSAAEQEFDLTEYVDLSKNPDIYIRIADAYPTHPETGAGNGWGGAIYNGVNTTLTVEYTPMAAEDLDAIEAAAGEGSVALFGFNKAVGGMTLDTEDKKAGSACNVFNVGGGKVSAIVLDAPVDGTGMDTLTFDLYVSDPAIFDMFAQGGMNSGLELTSSGECDQSEISWNLAAIKSSNIGGEIVTGWNHIVLPLETAASNPGNKNLGDFNISAVNYIRFFMVNETADTGITLKLDNMRLDNSGIERARIKAEEDQKVADKVIALIDDIGEVTLDSDSVITKAEDAYKDLTADQKALVTNKDAIKAAREAYDALVKAEEEKQQQQQQTPPEGTEGEGTEGEGTEGEGTEGEGTEGEGTEGGSEESGCASSITIGAGAMMLLAAAWVTMAARKKED
ncbi:MAG: hypothetical protein IJW40_02385 [Clostridia bacterium]|nr:hypothetical protein [Clostridia bacterium]